MQPVALLIRSFISTQTKKAQENLLSLLFLSPLLGRLWHWLELEVNTYTQYAVGASEAIGNLHA